MEKVLTYEEFKEKLAGEVHSHLPEEMKEKKVFFKTIESDDPDLQGEENYFGLQKVSGDRSPLIPCLSMYRMICDVPLPNKELGFGKAVSFLAKTFLEKYTAMEALDILPGTITKENAKDHLYCLVAGSSIEAKYAQIKIPTIEKQGISLSFRWMVSQNEKMASAALVTDTIQGMLGLSVEEMYEIGQKNINQFVPIEITQARNVFTKLLSESDMPTAVIEVMVSSMLDDSIGNTHFLTSKCQDDTALVHLFCQDTLQKVSEGIKGSFFAIPAGRAGLAILPDGGEDIKNTRALNLMEQYKKVAVEVFEVNEIPKIFHYNWLSESLTHITLLKNGQYQLEEYQDDKVVAVCFV